MLKKTLVWVAALAALATPAAANTISWIDWQSSSSPGGVFTALGQINSNGVIIDVTYTNPQGVSFIQTGTDTNYFELGSSGGNPYTSEGPNGNSNAPTPSEMIALRFAGTQTLSFSQTVENLYLSFVSLNGNGYTFDQDFEILSQTGDNIDGAGTDASGFWGSGQVARTDNGNGTYSISSTSGEPHGTLFFASTFDSLTWVSDTSEDWNGFTIGVQGTDAQVAPVVPVPASLPLLLAALGGVHLVARRRATSLNEKSVSV